MKWLIALLAMMVMVAGCTDSTSDDTGSEEMPEDEMPGNNETEEPEDNETEPQPNPVPGQNNGPSATLGVNNPGGSVPVTVNFTLGGSDPEGDALEWALDIDNDGFSDYEGSDLPSSVQHTYTEAGNVTVSFSVTDGEFTDYANVSLNLSEASGAQVVSGSWATGGTGCASPHETWAFGALSGVAVLEFEVEPATVGKTYVVGFAAPDSLFVGIDFYTEDGARVDGIYSLDEFELSATVPDAHYGLIYNCGTTGGSAVYSA